MSNGNGIRVFTGNAHQALAGKIADYLDVKVGKMTCTRFSDGECRVMVDESARGNDVHIIQPTCAPVNETLMELLVILDAFRRASVDEINVIIPYFGYSRQDKKIKPREPITAALVADLLQTAGATRVMVVDIHAEQIQGFFRIPVDHLYAGPLLVDFYLDQGYDQRDDITIVSPDVSGVARARNLAEALKAQLAIIAKRRPTANMVDIVEVIGDVKGRKCIMVDDMLDTGGSVIHGAEALVQRGAVDIEVAVTHPVFSGGAPQRLQTSEVVSRVVCMDTIPLPPEKHFDKLHVLSVAPLIGEAVKRLHNNTSVSELFNRWRVN
ncbi:MAG: ribose-phosphate pyrophosphokinase [Armatimonadetes bacterium]|nr:ribose-phosphate pyrophosphokinase [Armatimonadota bacterium]